jgi:ATP-dependent DNA helicase RecG
MDNQELNALLERLIKEGEAEYIEFKHNNLNPESIGQYLSALSNSAALHQKTYAYLVLGVEDDTLTIVGTNRSVKKEKEGKEELENWLINRLAPRIDFRVFEFEVPTGEKIVLLQIPAAKNQPVRFLNDAYIRVGSAKRNLKDFPEKEQKLWEKPTADFELEIAKYKVSAADVVALLDTQSVFDTLLKMPYPTTQKGVLDKMIEEKLIERSNGHYNITNLGALLFAKNLNQFDLERKAPRVVKYKGKSKLLTEKDQIGTLGYGTGFQRLMLYISGLVPSNEVIGIALRQEVQMYPMLALRELVANAIIHQDFRERGTYLSVEIFDDRIEISNPGLPSVDTLRFIDSYNARNQHFAAAMRRMGFCEEKGSGIDKVVYQCEFYQLPAPDFKSKLNQTVVTLFAHKSLNEMDKNDKIRACYQHCCLMYVTNQKMSNQTLRERFKIEDKNAAIVSRIIKDALEENLIKLENPDSSSRKFMTYIPHWA